MTAKTAGALALTILVGCSSVDELPTDLDPDANVVSASPVPFAPTHGAFGEGTFEEDPFTFLVMSQGALDNAGEEDCGQFVPRDGDLQVDLAGRLAPGEWTVQEEPAFATSGAATVSFANEHWTSGAVRVDEGSEARGATVSGAVDAKAESGAALTLTFRVLFHGCGRD